MDECCRRKGVEHALDHIGDSLNFVASGIGERVHDGRDHSYPPGHRHRRGTGPRHSGQKNILAILPRAGAGAVLGKGVVGRSRKILPNRTIASGEKVSQRIISPQTYREE